MSETTQYAMIGSAVCMAASEAQETSCGSGLRVYSGSGGSSYEVMLLAMAAVIFPKLSNSVLYREVAGGEVCYCYNCRVKGDDDDDAEPTRMSRNREIRGRCVARRS